MVGARQRTWPVKLGFSLLAADECQLKFKSLHPKMQRSDCPLHPFCISAGRAVSVLRLRRNVILILPLDRGHQLLSLV